MEDPPEPLIHNLDIILLAELQPMGLLLGLVVLVVLLICSALISGAEVAFFSLSRTQVGELEGSTNGMKQQVVKLLHRPKKLLATILVTNNFVNVGIVILSTFLVSKSVPVEKLNYLLAGVIPVGRIVEVFGITLIVLLFGEIIPKVYANQYAVAFSSFMSFPIYYLSIVFSFLSIPLIKMTSVIDRFAERNDIGISVDELTHALELTSIETPKDKEDRKILEGIVKFGNTDVKQIMKPRQDIEAVEASSNYHQLLEKILESGYSRIPIYDETLDKTLGVIHVKDLLLHMNEPESFDWKALMRAPFFVPESKMIDDLLEEFRFKKVHLAMVVDEYGGCEGLVTLEDILEEIVGDISDEFDDDEVVYSRLDDNNYVFEGKTNLKQFYRIMKLEGDRFEENKGEADTLAGFILEQAGKIPVKNQRVRFEEFEFTIESVDKRRIKRVKITRHALDNEAIDED